MSDVSGKIWSAVRDAQNIPTFDTSEKQMAYEDAYASRATDRIIAIVREALLSEAVVEEVAKKGGGYDDESWEDTLSHRKDRQIRDARHITEMLVDTAFGPAPAPHAYIDGNGAMVVDDYDAVGKDGDDE